MEEDKLLISLSEGEILDRYSILDIKYNEINDSTRKSHINMELEYYSRFDFLKTSYFIYYKLLYFVNKRIWDLTNIIKGMAQLNENYAYIAYDIFEYNQSRFRLKNIINNISNSKFKEQKSYNLEEVSVYIKNETNNIFNIVYSILNFDRVNVSFNKDVSSNYIAKILKLFPILEYSDDCTETLNVDFKKYNNSLLNKYINETIHI
jgi:hypothetical protein